MRTTILLASLLLASTVSAQVQVTGLELALDGALEVERGGALRLRATAFEVLGLSDLRPAAGARVFVSSSLDPAAEAAALTADEHGHVLVELPVPSDTDEPSFRVVLRLASASGATQRRFELPVRVLPPEALSFYAARESAPRGAPLRVFGRLYHVRSGRPLADQPVRVSASDEQGRPLVEPVELRTDTTGLFAHAFRAPADHLGPVRFEARAGALRTPVQAFAQTNVIRPEPGALLVAVAPDVSIATPGQRVNLEVVVRTGQGRPVQGAEVLAPHLLERDPSRRVLTDARGRARVYWEAPPLPTGARDHTPGVTATREGFGQGQGSALVRVAASEAFATLAVEGGALVPSLGGRLFVRVVGRDGRPLPSAQARITGPRLSAAPAASDADGIATLETRVGPPVGSDRCGGETATAVEIVIGHTMVASACVPLDPDGAARVRAAEPRVIAGSEVRLTVDRAQAATGAPVQLLAFAGPRLVASAVLPGRASQLALALPADVQGLLQIRARPLIGAAHQEVRGGSTAVWVAPGAAMAPLPLELGEASAALLGDERARAYVVAGPLDEARWLERILRSSVVGPLGDLRREPAAAGAALLQGALAARTTPDEAAPSVLRGRDVLGVPSPSDPVASGQLRDPWRARSRFVAGRLALILRALETYVAGAVPERLEDVAVRAGSRWDFNAQILASVAESGTLGPAGATGLSGEPLTIEVLRRFDPALTYDNVARRVTRERLFRLVLALRELVRQRGFDLPWSRLGEPGAWMRELTSVYVPGVGGLDQRALVDGWGQPFRLVPARGGRSRFRFVDSLGSWEIVSGGPDLRVGSGDDVWDPTARILRSGTPYADAVGEDVLVARLTGVELSRATIGLLESPVPLPRQGGAARSLGVDAWDRLPGVFDPDPDPLALRRPARPGEGAGGTIAPARAEVALRFDEEPRTWGVVAYAWTPEGVGNLAFASRLAGSPILLEGEPPSRLRIGEPAQLDLIATELGDAPRVLRVEAAGRGAGVRAPAELRLAPGEPSTFTVELTGGTLGRAQWSLRFLEGDRAVRTLEARTEVVSGQHPVRLRAAGWVGPGGWQTSLALPPDAERPAGRVVLLAPSALASDPDLADLRRREPALVAWATALAGRQLDPDLRARLLRSQELDGSFRGSTPLLATACAILALASAGEHDTDSASALTRATAWLGQADTSSFEESAAALGALAAAGVAGAGGDGDPVAGAALALRARLRRALRQFPEDGAILARAGAALLLADPRESYGRAMLARAASHLREPGSGGARVVPPAERDRPLESLAATLALAVAARQAGQVELAERLSRGAIADDHVVLRAGGEATFWWLAAGGYGALGEGASRATVFVDGAPHEVSLDQGRASLPLTGRAHTIEVRPAGGVLVARAELAVERPFAASASAGPLALSLEGDVGDVETGGALELVVSASERVLAPIVEVSLPAGVDASDERLRLFERGPVLRAEARRPGFLRLHLAALEAGARHSVSLPIRWTVRGSLRGLGAVAYPADRPEAMGVLPPRALEVGRGEAQGDAGATGT